MKDVVLSSNNPPAAAERESIEIIVLSASDQSLDEFQAESTSLLGRSTASPGRDPDDLFPSEAGPDQSPFIAARYDQTGASGPETNAPMVAVSSRRPTGVAALVLAAGIVTLMVIVNVHPWSRSPQPPAARSTTATAPVAPSESAPIAVDTGARQQPVPEPVATSSDVRPQLAPNVAQHVRNASREETSAVSVPRPSSSLVAVKPPAPTSVVNPIGIPTNAGDEKVVVAPITTATSRVTNEPAVAPPQPPAPLPSPSANATLAAAEAPAAAVVTPTRAIEGVLAQYQSAFGERNVAAMRQIWPTVDAKALAKAFDRIREARLTFDSCGIAVNGATAIGACTGTTQYVPKVGSKSPRVEQHQWQFSLMQNADRWVVSSIDVQ